MTTLYHTKISDVGAEAPDMLSGGVLILFKVGAPPELAEVSVLHEPDDKIGAAPKPGDTLATSVPVGVGPDSRMVVNASIGTPSAGSTVIAAKNTHGPIPRITPTS